MIRRMLAILMAAILSLCFCRPDVGSEKRWIERPQNEWPQISMINNIEYIDESFPVAGCSFLLNTGEDTVAVTAKHILTYFKTKEMNSVSFDNTLKSWKMYPKNNSKDVVIIDSLINENPDESIDRIPAERDWLLFTIRKKSPHIQPLEFRTSRFIPNEKVYIIGWRYSDRNCSQVIYNGNFVKVMDGSVIISKEKLSDNTMPGLSGSPVIDSNGYLIGIMSRKYGKMEKASAIEYPRKILQRIKK